MDDREKKFLSPQEAISLLGISYPTLLRRVKAGRMPVIRIGKQLRFPIAYFNDIEHSALEEFNNHQEEENA